MSEIKNLTIDELKLKLDRGNDFHFWNVLTDDYFHGEMIPGSHRIPIDGIAHEVSEMNVPKTSEIVVYCAGPNCLMSKMAAEKLQKLGFTNIWTFEGGVEEWKKAGYEVVNLETESKLFSATRKS